MRKLTLMLCSVAVVTIMSSCSKNPKACFTVHVSQSAGNFVQSNAGKVGESFFFSPMCSEEHFGGATVFDYGDGNTGEGYESHVYSKPGTYSVKCTVFGVDHGQKAQKSDQSSQTITVTSPQTAQNQSTVKNDM